MQRITLLPPALAAAMALALLLSAVGRSVHAQDAPAANAGILAHWTELDAAWDARDAQRFAALFTVDADFEIVGRGQPLLGRSAIDADFSQRFPGFPPELRHRTRIDRIGQPAPGLWAIDGGVDVVRIAAEDDAATLLRGFALFALMRQDEAGWRIHALRAYELPPAAETAAR